MRGPPGSLTHGSSSVVAVRPKPRVGYTPPPAIARPHSHNGCLSLGLGGLPSRHSEHPPLGNLDIPGACSPHQHPRAEGNSPDTFGSGTADSGQVHSARIGQFHLSSLCQQTGQDSLSFPIQGGSATIRPAAPQRNLSVSSAPSRSSGCYTTRTPPAYGYRPVS